MVLHINGFPIRGFNQTEIETVFLHSQPQENTIFLSRDDWICGYGCGCKRPTRVKSYTLVFDCVGTMGLAPLAPPLPSCSMVSCNKHFVRMLLWNHVSIHSSWNFLFVYVFIYICMNSDFSILVNGLECIPIISSDGQIVPDLATEVFIKLSCVSFCLISWYSLSTSVLPDTGRCFIQTYTSSTSPLKSVISSRNPSSF